MKIYYVLPIVAVLLGRSVGQGNLLDQLPSCAVSLSIASIDAAVPTSTNMPCIAGKMPREIYAGLGMLSRRFSLPLRRCEILEHCSRLREPQLYR